MAAKRTQKVSAKGFLDNPVQEMLFQNFLNTGAMIGESTLKNPKSKAKFRKGSLALFRMFKAAYAGDPDFE